ncbi:MAG TPA: type II secretion system F family protein [Acidimicrobiales bacterium]|nr:type II secretion system F family protein [Acidimicrobiales bacterium]
MTLMIIVAIATSCTTVAFLLMAQHGERVAVQGALREIERTEGDVDARDTALSQPLKERVILPIFDRAVGLVHRLTPADYVANVRHKLILTGQHGDECVDRFLATRLLVLAALPLGFVLTFVVLHMHGASAYLMVGLIGGMSVMGPSASLNRRIGARRTEVSKALPDVLDLLTISVEAGLGFEQALDRAVDAVPGPLTEELARMLGEMRAGARRSDALRAFSARVELPEIQSFTLAVLQADAFGVSITRVLRSQADEMRIRRRLAAQEKAMKAPVKMLVPMVFCIFPSLFTVVLGPAALNILQNFK